MAFALSCRVHRAITVAVSSLAGVLAVRSTNDTRVKFGMQFVNPDTQRTPCREAQSLDGGGNAAPVFEIVPDSFSLWASEYFGFEIT